MKLVFVSGPYSGNVVGNASTAIDLCIQVAAAGAMPICANVYTDPRFMEVRDYAFWIEATKATMLRCDAVIFTHDYKNSRGALGEEKEAENLNMPRFYSAEVLSEWVRMGDQ